MLPPFLRRPGCLLLFALLTVRAWAATPGPTITETSPEPGSIVDHLASVEILFSTPVLGVDASDLLINGSPATSVSETAPGHFLFSFSEPAPGAVTFLWGADHGITESSDVSRLFNGGTWNLQLDAALARRRVSISEFMADNDVALYDDDCDRSDWIEIHNGSGAPINLLDWSLTDDPLQPAKWRFPAHTLEPNAFLVVFASQKNKTNLPPRACRTRSNSLAGYHTNFRLNPEGEYLALNAPDGEVISEFAPTYPPQRRDVSYGRDPASPTSAGFFTKPTPRAANSTTGNGFAPAVRFSRPGTPFVDRFALTLSSDDPGAVIRYTLDGSFPTETAAASRTYTAPIAITNTVQVRARAFRTGLLPGLPASETYLLLTNQPAQLASFTSALPVLLISTLKTATIGASGNTAVHVSLFEPRDGRASLLDRPTLTSRAGVKTRGSSTGGQPQSNFALEWWDELNQDRDLPILGMPEDSEWVLYAPNEYDAALIHNPFTMELSRQMNFAAPQTRFVEVYLNKGGPVRSNDWFGLYVLMQKPGLAKGRIEAPKAGPEDTLAPEVTGSYLFKTDRLDPGDSGFSAGGAQNCYVEPKEREMRSPQRAPQVAYLTQFFRNLDNALRSTNPNFRDPVLGYRGYLEITNWVDFHMLELLSGQVDAIRLSTYFYKRREGKLEYGPRWDYDRAWESKGDDRDNNPRVWDSGGGLFGNPWWSRVLADRDAWQLWIDRFQGFRRTTFSQSNMFSVIDAMTNRIGFIQPREARRWPATAPRASYRNEIGIMKTWISNRLAWIDSQLAQPPRLSSPGGPVTAGFQLTLQPPASVSNPNNVALFYTLDGTDPRPSRGTNEPLAFRYSGPITVRTNTRVIARTRDTGRIQRGPLVTSTWSSPVIATFLVTPPALAISELMYHPADPPAGSPYSESDFEFLELRNVSNRLLDLAGHEFSAGIAFRFDATNRFRTLAPGQRLLLVSHQDAFLTRHPGLADLIAGQFEGNLADEGERLALTGPAGETVFDFTYSDQWQPATDGLGFALVPLDENPSPTQLGDPARWQRGTHAGGSPGLPESPASPPPPRVVIQEILPAPTAGADEWIELFNPDSQEADVSGWWLSDSFDFPRKARLPAGSRIPPGGLLLVREKTFSPGNGSGPGFRLASAGEEIWLLSASPDGELTGWFHGFNYQASPEGTSIGRELTSDGREHFVPQSIPSPGRPNTEPALGPILFTEVAPQRTPTGVDLGIRDGFLELSNLGTARVPLFDPALPARTWRLRGDLDFDLPTGISLAPGERLLIVAFDPVLDPYELAGFQQRHALAEPVRIVGPWHGETQATGPRLRLLRPQPLTPGNGDPENYLLVEEAPLHTHPGWFSNNLRPGFSLTRRSPAGFAGEPTQWSPTPSTPGRPDLDLDGLPDAWEQTHNLASQTGESDADGDGFTQGSEFRNGTDPRDPSEALRLRMFASGRGLWTGLFDATPRSVYVLEIPENLASGVWTISETLTVPESGTAVFRFQPRPTGSQLFRLRSR
jgi:hypothetical protein